MNFKLLLSLSTLFAASLAAPAGVDDNVTFVVYSKGHCPAKDKSLPLSVKCGQTQNIFGYETGTRSLKITGYGGANSHLKAIQACFSYSADGSGAACSTVNVANGLKDDNCITDSAKGDFEYVTFVCIKK